MRNFVVVLSLLLCPLGPAVAQVSVQIGLPSVSIGINQPVYPRMVAVPGYPVYYAPNGNSNYFFYDGLYWAYEGDNWYASSWFNGPWALVAPQLVPAFILRVPVRYYHQPPAYFRGWSANAPPRWGEHWGNDWERQRGGWDRWNHGNAPRPAPLPAYQKPYSGDRYPHADLQHTLRSKNYRYQPTDAAARVAYQAQDRRGGSDHDKGSKDKGSKDKGSKDKGGGPDHDR
jgi:hypothetical protein